MDSVATAETPRSGNRTVVRTYIGDWRYQKDAPRMEEMGYQIVSTTTTRDGAFVPNILVTYRWAGAGEPPLGEGQAPKRPLGAMGIALRLLFVLVAVAVSWVYVLPLLPGIF